MENVLEAIVALLDATARFENRTVPDTGAGSIDAARNRIMAEACRAAAAEIRGALIRAARI